MTNEINEAVPTAQEKGWLATMTKGSKGLQSRLKAAHSKNPDFQKFLTRHGFDHEMTTTAAKTKPEMAGMDKEKTQQAPEKNPDVPMTIRQQNQAKQNKYYGPPSTEPQAPVDPKKKAQLLAAMRSGRGGRSLGDTGSSAGAAVRHVMTGGTLKMEEVEQVDEVLSAATPVSTWIHDFVHSTNPKFEGKSKEQRKTMALGAYYAAKRGK